MGRVKQKKSKGTVGRIAKSVVSAVSPRAGNILSAVGRVTSKVAGRGKAEAQARGKRRSKGFNINKFAKKLMKQKLDNRLMKEKLKVLNSIK